MPAQTLLGLAIVLGGLGSALGLINLVMHGARWNIHMADLAAATAAANALTASAAALTTAADAAAASIAAGAPDLQPLVDTINAAKTEVDAATTTLGGTPPAAA